MSEESNIEQQEPVTPAQRIRTDWRQLLEKVSYKGIVSNVPFLVYVAILLMLYITNSNHAVQVQQELNTQHVVLKELRWKHMDIKSKLMNAGMEDIILKRGSSLGLMPLRFPAYSLVVDSNKTPVN